MAAENPLVNTNGQIIKMEVDYSTTCDEKIPQSKKLASEGKMHDALDALLALEKQTRTVSFIFYPCFWFYCLFIKCYLSFFLSGC